MKWDKDMIILWVLGLYSDLLFVSEPVLDNVEMLLQPQPCNQKSYIFLPCICKCLQGQVFQEMHIFFLIILPTFSFVTLLLFQQVLNNLDRVHHLSFTDGWRKSSTQIYLLLLVTPTMLFSFARANMVSSFVLKMPADYWTFLFWNRYCVIEVIHACYNHF